MFEGPVEHMLVGVTSRQLGRFMVSNFSQVTK